MKRNIFLYASLLILSLSACKKDDTTTTENGVSEEQTIQTQMSSGTWRVTNFYMLNSDQTSDFNNFKFTFSGGGNTAAANDLLTENGSWSVVKRNEKPAVTLNYVSVDALEPFIEVSGDFWKVLSHSDTRIDMERVMTDAGRTDHLTIEKN